MSTPRALFTIALATAIALVAVGCARTPDAQDTYLDAVQHRNDVLARIQTDPPPSWTGLRTLAGEMVTAEEEEAATLEAATWPGAAKSPLAQLLEEVHKAIPYWEKAAKGQDEVEVNTNTALALKYCGGPAAGRVRATLGLPLA